MRQLMNLLGVTAAISVQLAVPVLAAPGDRPDRPGGGQGQRPGGGQGQRPGGGQGQPGGPQIQPPRPQPRPPGNGNGYRPNPGRPNPGYNRPNPGNPGYRPNPSRPGGGNTYPIYRPPGGIYRPPGGGYYRPPRPPSGGWQGGYRPPSQYYYNDGPSVGGIIAGVAVTAGLLALLNSGSNSSQQQSNGNPVQAYTPPPQSNGAPAAINVDLGGITPSARPSASTCLTEASRQIGATGGKEIRLDRIVSVEPGNGGYRFRLDLIGVYPDETRTIPMFCRATPDKIVELTFG